MAVIPYADTTFAFEYFADRLGSEAYDDASNDDKIKALKTSTLAIDTLNFAGRKADPTQVNQFPRGGDTVVPVDVQQACCELALKLLDDVDAEIEFENLGANAMSIGDARLNRDTRVTPEHILAGIPSLRAWNLLKPYLRDPGHATMLRDS